MTFSKRKPKPEPAFEPEHVYQQRLSVQVIQVTEKIKEVFNQPSEKKIWCQIGDLHYGHQVTPLLLKQRGLMWQMMHPPDPRGERMFKRIGPYHVNMESKDIKGVFYKGIRTAQRLLNMARVALGKKPKAFITVEEFCYLHSLREETIQKKLHELFMEKWNKYKKDHPDEDLD
jgi:hypothetical protein